MKLSITMLLIFVTILGCSKSNVNSTTEIITGPGNTNTNNQLAIGQNYQGGIIIHFFVKGDNRYVAGETHGIIASDIDYSGTWSTEVTLLNNSKIVLTSVDSIENSSIGMSKFNTEKIVRNFTYISTGGPGGSIIYPTPFISQTQYAAKICDTLKLNNYSDWYLPTIDELLIMNTVQDKIKLKSSTKYWSSNAIIQPSKNTLYYNTSKQVGTVGTEEKTNQLNGNVMLIRPVRYF